MGILRDTGMTLSENKCHYSKQKVKFLGHIVTAVGLKPDSSKIKALQALKVPENVRTLLRFLGIVTWQSSYSTSLKVPIC